MGHVITRLMGGLGNQLFQYAAGLALADRLGVPLLLDRTYLDDRPAGMNWTARTPELDLMRAPVVYADEALVRRMRRPLDDRWYGRASRILPKALPDHTIREGLRRPDASFSQVKAPVYLDGFWQNERYFLPVAHELREELFVPKAPPSTLNSQIQAAMRRGNTASIHVRRGDYVSNPEANKFHGVCSVEYYTAAAEFLAQEVGVEHFYLFSDEPEWVRRHIQLPYSTTYVEHNTGRDGLWDMWLMKQCTHHIIANSSFSWWGAWLNPSPTKTVIAPARWFQGGSMPAAAILPPSWIAR